MLSMTSCFIFVENQGLCRIKRAPGPRTGSVAAHPTSTVFPSWTSTVKCVEHTKNVAKVTGFPEEVIWFWTLCWLHIYSGLIPCGCAFLFRVYFYILSKWALTRVTVFSRGISKVTTCCNFLLSYIKKFPIQLNLCFALLSDLFCKSDWNPRPLNHS